VFNRQFERQVRKAKCLVIAFNNTLLFAALSKQHKNMVAHDARDNLLWYDVIIFEKIIVVTSRFYAKYILSFVLLTVQRI
jgi:hypothetical protein